MTDKLREHFSNVISEGMAANEGPDAISDRILLEIGKVTMYDVLASLSTNDLLTALLQRSHGALERFKPDAADTKGD